MERKKPNIFLKVVLILFLIYIALFIISKTGYYEAKVSQNVSLTNDAIKNFEKDVLEGKTVDINSYIATDNKDYSNFFTKITDKLGDATVDVVSGSLTSFFDLFKYLFT